MKIRIFVLLLLFLQLTSAAAKPWTEVQAGISYNRMNWKINNSFLGSHYSYKRNKLMLQPCLRLTAHFNVYTKDTVTKVSVSTFIGAHIFGGKGKSDTSSYKDKHAFYSFEGGIYPAYHINQWFSIGSGVKVNYTPLIMRKNFGTVNQYTDDQREWTRENISDRFQKVSYNAGVIITYRKRRYTLSADAWFGLRDLNKLSSPHATITIRENNYRLLVGYRL